MPWMHRRDKLSPASGKAARSLDFPIRFRVRGAESPVSATLLQLGLGGCRIRTWRIMPQSETVRIELPLEDGETLLVVGRVYEAAQTAPNVYEYTIDLAPLDADKQDRLAREAASLVRRRHNGRLAS